MSNFTSIDPAMLEGVIGGARPPVSPGITGASTSSNDQLLAAVQGIQSSLKDLNKPKNDTNQFLLMGVMAMAMRQRNSQTVVGPGYYYSSVG
jgi:hypothetical protein